MALDIARIISLLGATSPGIIVLYILVIIIAGYNGVEIFKWFKSKKQDPKNGHKDALIHLFREARNLMDYHGQIKHYQIVDEQMRYAEELIDKIKSAYTDSYVDALKKETGKELDDTTEFLRFELVLDYALLSGKDFLRFLMKRNKLMEKTNSELQHYIEDNTKAFINRIERTLDKIYPLFTFTISRHNVYQHTRNDRGDVKRWFGDFIHMAQDISEKKYDEMQIIEGKLAELTDYVLRLYTGEEE